jgi:hypothetical protein
MAEVKTGGIPTTVKLLPTFGGKKDIRIYKKWRCKCMQLIMVNGI